eukprot:Polyplicarium_translucidae@DN3175_c0_g2_i1.p4
MNSVFINNKHGTLVYEKHFSPTTLSSNDTIILASTFHGICGIANRVAPVAPPRTRQFGFMDQSGITSIDGAGFSLVCFESLTGVSLPVLRIPSQGCGSSR